MSKDCSGVASQAMPERLVETFLDMGMFPPKIANATRSSPEVANPSFRLGSNALRADQRSGEVAWRSRTGWQDRPVASLADDSTDSVTSIIQRAAERGDPVAQVFLGDIYLHEFGVTKDLDLAMHWYRRAAEGGQVVAAISLGCIYAEGVAVDRDLSRAARWFRRGAERGDALAQYNLGVCYLLRDEGALGEEKAFKCFRAAAGIGHPPAQCQTGLMYATG